MLERSVLRYHNLKLSQCPCLYARFFFDRFCAGYDSASQAGGGTEEPIYSQALVLEPRHGLPPPPPQIASRFAAQINLEGQEKIQATALCRRVSESRRECPGR